MATKITNGWHCHLNVFRTLIICKWMAGMQTQPEHFSSLIQWFKIGGFWC